MNKNPQDKPTGPIRETDNGARRLAKTLLRAAMSGALSFLDPATGSPLISRVGVATSAQGDPVILISELAAHTRALRTDKRCALLLGEPGKGDPLAHPRISLSCTAQFEAKSGLAEEDNAARYLRAQPKARLYAGFVDFSFVRLHVCHASLNGGFGQAFNLTRGDLMAPPLAVTEELMAQLDADSSLAARLAGIAGPRMAGGNWRIANIDSEGLTLAKSENRLRLWFNCPVMTQDELPQAIRSMTLQR